MCFLFPVAISQIKEVRVGKNTEILRNKDIAGHYPDECAFSIIYGDNFETMDLIANTPDEMNIWVTGLTCLTSGKSPSRCMRRKLLLFVSVCSASGSYSRFNRQTPSFFTLIWRSLLQADINKTIISWGDAQILQKTSCCLAVLIPK